jgi:16S rRNA (guanine1516-N2)-methyltransferase
MVTDSMQTVLPEQLGMPIQDVTVLPASGESPKRAREIATRLALLYCDRANTSGPHLVVGETAAWVELAGVKVAIRFDSSTMRHRRRGGHNELLGRAVGVKENRYPAVFDATGGLARDAFLLADLGCNVTICERVPVLAWLLQDAVAAAEVSVYGEVREAAGRMHVIAGDSQERVAEPHSVIYLDPMFPERKKAAAVKKEAALLQCLTQSLDDSDSLWAWASQQAVERIVVKRPLRAPTLGQAKPSHTLSGKAVRFDVFVRQPASGGSSDSE